MRALTRSRTALASISFHRRCSTAAASRVDRWISEFTSSLTSGSAHEAFAPDRCFWRDMVAFTWDIRTFEGASEICGAMAATAPATRPHSWRLDGEPTEGADGGLDCWLRFSTAAGGGKAHLRLDAQGKASTLLTVLTGLEARPWAMGRQRPLGHPCESVGQIATARPRRRYWHERRAASLPSAVGGEGGEPYVLIIGGGQVGAVHRPRRPATRPSPGPTPLCSAAPPPHCSLARCAQGGLSLGARLKLLGVPYLIVEQHPRVGDSWRARYPGAACRVGSGPPCKEPAGGCQGSGCSCAPPPLPGAPPA